MQPRPPHPLISAEAGSLGECSAYQAAPPPRLCFQRALVALIPSIVISAPGQLRLALCWCTPFTLPAPLQLSFPRISPSDPSWTWPDPRKARCMLHAGLSSSLSLSLPPMLPPLNANKVLKSTPQHLGSYLTRAPHPPSLPRALPRCVPRSRGFPEIFLPPPDLLPSILFQF